jgi:sortase A
VLADGPGHYRSTVFPGGGGTSVILGRASAYGGPFGDIAKLKKGDRITVVTQVGTAHFRVVDTRTGGIEHRRIPVTQSRLALGTAAGPAFAPTGVFWVDAEGIGAPLAAFRPAVRSAPADEQPLGLETGELWVLGLLLLGVAIVATAAVWTWRRRGHAQAWIVFTAPLLLLWMFTCDQIARLLPNLL